MTAAAVFSAIAGGADGELGARDVIVYGGRDANRGQAEPVQLQRTGEAPSASDHDESLCARATYEFYRPLLAYLALLELRRAARAEDGSTLLHIAPELGAVDGPDLASQQPVISLRDSQNLPVP